MVFDVMLPDVVPVLPVQFGIFNPQYEKVPFIANSFVSNLNDKNQRVQMTHFIVKQ